MYILEKIINKIIQAKTPGDEIIDCLVIDKGIVDGNTYYLCLKVDGSTFRAMHIVKLHNLTDARELWNAHFGQYMQLY